MTSAGGIGAVMSCGAVGAIAQAADHQQELDQEHDPDQRAHREVVEKALTQLGEIDVEHHHDEQEQHRDGADIDDDQDHRQELGAHEHEQAGRVDEGEDQEQHGMHGIARGDHHEGGRHADAGEQIKEQGGENHRRLAVGEAGCS